MAYIVIQVEDAAFEPFWTLLDASSGRDLRNEHRYPNKHVAEEIADRLNGVPLEPED